MKYWGRQTEKTDWNTLQGKPQILTDDLIDWNEIQGEPPIESGVFDARLRDSSGFSFSQNTQSGKYYRIGNICFFSIYKIASLSSYNGTNNVQLWDLPFAFPSGNQMYITGIWYGTNSLIATPLLLSLSGQNKIGLFYIADSTAQSLTALMGNILKTSGLFTIRCSGHILL